jgi:hypothetical protein
MASPKTELHDFQGKLIHETEKAYLIEIYVIGKGEVKEWFPKQATQDNEDGTFTTTEYWATEKGLI